MRASDRRSGDFEVVNIEIRLGMWASSAASSPLVHQEASAKPPKPVAEEGRSTGYSMLVGYFDKVETLREYDLSMKTLLSPERNLVQLCCHWPNITSRCHFLKSMCVSNPQGSSLMILIVHEYLHLYQVELYVGRWGNPEEVAEDIGASSYVFLGSFLRQSYFVVSESRCLLSSASSQAPYFPHFSSVSSLVWM